jgi:hypothetical protein
MNPNDAANVAAKAGTNGLTPAAAASGMMMGTTAAAEAVFDVVSGTVMASSTPKTVMAMGLLMPSASYVSLTRSFRSIPAIPTMTS